MALAAAALAWPCFVMPRKLRVHVPDGIYHVTLRGNHRQRIFNHDGERTLLNIIVARAIERYAARVHAYCWMTNHLHLLIQCGDTPLGRPMQQIASEYARAFQQNISTTGHLFENRYHATLVQTDAYFLEALRYVHQNPIEAGMVASLNEYRWSSHRAYVANSGEPWVTTSFALNLLSSDPARAVVLYRAFMDKRPALDVAAELAMLEKGVATLGKPETRRKDSPDPPSASDNASLEDVTRQACERFGVTETQLRSAVRITRLVTARRWVARAASATGRFSIAEIARHLNRDEATIRRAIRDADDGAPKVMPVFPL